MVRAEDSRPGIPAVRRGLALSVAFNLTVLISAVVLVAVAGFFLGIPITAFHLPASLLAAVAASLAFARPTSAGAGARAPASGWLLALALGLFSASLSVFFLDVSADGQHYHQPAAIALAEGWNPVVQNDPGNLPLQAVYFPKSSWIVSAVLFKATGLVEIGKAFNLVTLFISFIVVLLLLDNFSPANRASNLIFASLVSLNPVSLTQLATFYVDGALYSLLVTTAAGSVLYSRTQDRRYLVIASLAFVLCATVKFTGLVYSTVVCALIFVYYIVARRRLAASYGAACALAFASAVLFVGYQPYVTNTVNFGNPFYPVIGKAAEARLGRENIIAGSASPEFTEKDRFAKLALSIFSYSRHGPGESPTLKPPGAIELPEIYAFGGPDARFGGFGPLFSAALVLTAAVFAASFVRLQGNEKRIALLCIAGIVLSIAPNAEAWWARLAPQIWLIPLTMLIVANRVPSRLLVWAGRAAIALLAVNVGIVAGANFGANLVQSVEFRRQMAHLNEFHGDSVLEVELGRSDRERLSSLRARYEIVDEVSCRDPMILVGSGTSSPGRICIKGKRLSHFNYRDTVGELKEFLRSG